MAFKLDFEALSAELDRRAALTPEQRAEEDAAEAANRLADEIAADERRRDALVEETLRVTLTDVPEVRYQIVGGPLFYLRGVDRDGFTVSAVHEFPAHGGRDAQDDALAGMLPGCVVDLDGFWRSPSRGRGYEFLAVRFWHVDEVPA